jgi:uncharacterized protein (TIGR02466 family)
MNQTPEHEIHGLFPCPVYIIKRDSIVSPKEKKEIGTIIQEGMHKNYGNTTSNNSYIFNSKLKNIKQFCEQQLKIYIEEVISPEEELDFYITQSWLNITKPGEYHHEHSHQNSIISGVFYVSTEDNDNIMMTDLNLKLKQFFHFPPKEYNIWNSSTWNFLAKNNELILFPSWLTHQVNSNEKGTTDRISISFNTFVRGILGNQDAATQLILK